MKTTVCKNKCKLEIIIFSMCLFSPFAQSGIEQPPMDLILNPCSQPLMPTISQ